MKDEPKPTFPSADAARPLAVDCKRCPDLVESRDRIAWGNGPLDASIVVIGEAPAAGDPEAERWRGGNPSGMAYTSRRSGRKIRRLCADAGLGVSSECYFTNAIKCFPRSDTGDGNRDPTATERANCRPYLLEEIRRIEPDVLLPTGKHATRSVFAVENRSLDGFLEVVLDPIDCSALETTAIPLVHPAYQEVWIGRLGYSYRGYVDRLREMLQARDVQ